MAHERSPSPPPPQPLHLGDFLPATRRPLLSQVVVELDVLPLGLLRVHTLIFPIVFNVDIAGALTSKSFVLKKKHNTNMSVFYLAYMQLLSACRENEKKTKKHKAK